MDDNTLREFINQNMTSRQIGKDAKQKDPEAYEEAIRRGYILEREIEKRSHASGLRPIVFTAELATVTKAGLLFLAGRP